MTNAFGRSGSVYLSSFIKEYSPKVFVGSTHVASYLKNKNVNHVLTVRNPYECISSYAYMHWAGFNGHILANEAKTYMKQYLEHIDYYNSQSDKSHIYAVDFQEMSTNTHNIVKNIFSKFNIDHDESINLSSEDMRIKLKERNLLGDRTGHMPREKTLIRLEIEKAIKNFDFMEYAYSQYIEFKKNIL